MTVNTTLPVTNSQISTHTLTWSVTGTKCTIIINERFQLTRSRGAWRKHTYILTMCEQFQLTRSRGAWPRTRGSMGQQCRFQLTRSRGAWLRPAEIAPSARDFNSHAHVERDVFNPLFVCVMFDFNSHAHVERDFFVCTRSHSIFRFQLTRSRGAWLYRRGCRPVCRNFNSHAHVERDNQLRLHNKNI